MALSRLDYQERSRLLKQTILFFSGGVGVILIFVFILLPIFSKILAFTNKQSLLPVNTPAPIVMPPTLQQPYTATNSAVLTLRGTAQPEQTVLLGQNGAIEKKTTVGSDGQYTFLDIILEKGDNMFQTYVEDANGNRSDGSPQITITYNTDAPKLEVSEPVDGSTVIQRKQQVITIKGTTDPSNKVYVNEQFLFVSSDGSFTGQVQLQNGANTIHVRAINTAGNEVTKDITVNYSP
jgi:hypothetical protein